MHGTKNNYLILILLLLSTALVYTNSLKNPFTPDDRLIILDNFRSSQSWKLENFFSRSLFGYLPSEHAYLRPLTLFSFALNYPMAGDHPAGYRAVNIAIHLWVITLVFILFSRLTEKWIAAFSTLLFALHPVHVQAVSYISSRSDPLYTCLALLTLLFWHQASENQESHRRLYLSTGLALFFLGLFAKETMIVVIPLAGLMDLVWNRKESWRDKLRDNLGWYLGLVVLLVIYLLLRSSLGYSFLMKAGIEINFGYRVLLALKLFGLYLALAFYPAHLSLFRTSEVPQSFFEWQVVVGTILLIGMLLLAWLSRRDRKEISFGISWYLVSLLPVLNLTLLNAPMMEHWLYLPLIGLTLAFVGGVRCLAERVGKIRGAAIGLILLALMLSARTVTRNAEWSDPIEMLSRDVASYPANYLAWFWLGDALKNRGMLDGAIHAFKTGLAIDSNSTAGWTNLGDSLSLARRDPEAEVAFSRASFIEPNNPVIHHRLAIHQLKMGKNLATIETVKKSIHFKPSVGAYHVLGSAYQRLGRTEDAEDAFSKALTLHRGEGRYHGEFHVNLGKLYLGEEKRREAQQEFELALRFDPNSGEARALLGKVKNLPARAP